MKLSKGTGTAIAALLLTLFACESPTKEEKLSEEITNSSELPKADQSAKKIEYDTKYDNISSFISGIKPQNNSETNLDSTIAWKNFSSSFDSIWQQLEKNRLEKMKVWRDEELNLVNKEIQTVFYPFSGPDFLNADVFFHNAKTFVLVGLEPAGALPELSKMNANDMEKYINSVNISLNDLFKRSYFITKNMLGDLSKNNVNGTLPVMCIFLKRSGHTITDISYVGVDSTGNVIPRTDTIPFKGSKGVKVTFFPNGSNELKTAFYFKTDLSDGGLKANPGFTTFINNLNPDVTYLKAASHLLHYGSFSTVRNAILNNSKAVVQDDSGIAYKFFDKEKWDIKLYGKYSKAVKDFAGVNQPELKKAYESDSTVKPLPFSLGYHWGTKEVNLMVAIRRKN